MKIVELFIKYFPTYLSAFGVTLKITALSLLIGTAVGIVFAIFKLSGKKPLEVIANVYISIIRGTPLMVQILFIYLGIPALLNFKWQLTVACVVIMSVNCGAYMAELIRGGIEAVDKGQVEAANSLGMNYAQTMMKVILPQALRIMLPTIINQFIVTLKDTSLLSVIALRELTQNTKIIVANNMETFTMYFICGVWYWVIVTILSRIAKYIERRTKYGK
ncbi:MAG: amino acid ABC transporter permease [Clostridiales bacterium]|nr:amino acid ABC transporter permease [Clostridiales bacterium]